MSVNAATIGAFAWKQPEEPAYAFTASVSAYAAARSTTHDRGRSLLVVIVPLVLLIAAAVILGGGPVVHARALHLSGYAESGASAAAMLGAVPAGDQPATAAAPPPAAIQTPKPTTGPKQVAARDRPAVAHRRDDYNVQGPPSVSAATIDRVLASYGSPAVGTGQIFYDLGVKYGIDPAYSLAFYIHESDAGTKGVARFTHGIGNIRVTPGYADYEGYRSYPTYAAGIEDWFKLIHDLYIGGWGLATPDAIIARYAPWGDNNNPTIYANNVKFFVDSWQEK